MQNYGVRKKLTLFGNPNYEFLTPLSEFYGYRLIKINILLIYIRDFKAEFCGFVLQNRFFYLKTIAF